MNLHALLVERFRSALTALSSNPAKYAGLIKATDPRNGDYQANMAMPLAKELGQPPREIANHILQRLRDSDLLASTELAGPGFINLRIQSKWLGEQLAAIANDDRLGIARTTMPKTIILDYSSPNVAKPLHVGHLRSTIIGDALKRLLQFLGHHVIADNHLGDWGTQFGMLLYGYKKFRDETELQSDPVRELVRIYQMVRAQTRSADKENDDPGEEREKYTPEQIAEAKRVLELCRQETAKLQAGDPENTGLWRQFIPWSMATITPIYERLHVAFDHFHGESFYNHMLAGVVDDLLAKGLATTSQGAVVVFLTPPPKDGSEHRADAVVRKKDGAFTYMTSDLATIQYRMKEWNPDAILYVVGAPQSKHFETLFAVAKRWGYDRVDLRHIGFGSVLGNDRKMLSTRNGGAAELSELLETAVAKADRQYQEVTAERKTRGEFVPDVGPEEQHRIAEDVGIAAVKYADLSQHRTTDYTFSWDKMLAMDGNTATYMQYAYARCRSIFRKGDIEPEDIRTNPTLPKLDDPHERALALKIVQFEEMLVASATDYLPHLITSYLWDLAKTYSIFFTNCPVLKAPSPELKRQRLLLCDLTARTIELALSLLGIRVVERM